MKTKPAKTSARRTSKRTAKPAAKPITPAPRLYAIMKAFSWSALKIGSHSVTAPDSGPQRFMPLFTTREAALQWDPTAEVLELESA